MSPPEIDQESEVKDQANREFLQAAPMGARGPANEHTELDNMVRMTGPALPGG